MNESRRLWIQVLAASSTGLASHGVVAQAEPMAGRDFRVVNPAQPVEAPAGRIEVLEFFAYTCIHCYNFEPLLTAWMAKKPANVVVRRTPVAFSPAMEPLQRLYYALEAMGKVEALHEKAFRAVHVDKVRLQDPAVMADWIAQQGVDKTQFNQFYNSFGVAGKAKRATQLQDAYQVEGTPALGVAGRYYISGQGPRTLAVAEALIAQLRKA